MHIYTHTHTLCITYVCTYSYRYFLSANLQVHLPNTYYTHMFSDQLAIQVKIFFDLLEKEIDPWSTISN